MTDPVVWPIVADKNGELNIYGQLTRKNPDGTRSPIDLTDKVLWLQVRQYEGAPDPPYAEAKSTDTTGDRISFLNAPLGKFWIHIGEPKLESMPSAPLCQPPAQRAVTFVHDMKLDGEVYARGTFTVRQGVTRE